MIANRQDRIVWLLAAAVCLLTVFLFIINRLCPIMGEDVALAAILPHDEVASLSEFFSKMFSRVISQATNWNARIGELASIVFSCFPKIIFDAVNTAATVGIVHLMYRYAWKKRDAEESNPVRLLGFYLLALILIILFLPSLGEILFWRTGCTNYWWSAGLLLLAGLPLREYIGSERLDRIESTAPKIILFAALSFAAGFTNENNVSVFIFLYLCTIAYDLIRYQREHAWVIINFICMCSGYLILLTCQSTRNRIAYYNSAYNIHGNFLENAVERIPNTIGTYFSTNYIILFILLSAVMLFVITVAVKFRNAKTIEFIKELYKSSDVFGLYIVSLTAAAALIGSPYIEQRAYLLCNLFSITCICFYLGLSIRNIKTDTNRLRKHLAIITFMTLSATVFIGFCHECARIYTAYYEYSQFTEKRNSLMEDAHKGGYKTEWPIYHYKDNRELNTREEYLYLQPHVVENYYGIQLKK